MTEPSPWSRGPPAAGHATALELAAQGASVALVRRRKEGITDLAAEVSAAGGKALVVPTDITDDRAAEQAVEQTVEGLGRLDILVNNAGLMLLGPAIVQQQIATSLGDIDRLQSQDASATLRTTSRTPPCDWCACSTGLATGTSLPLCSNERSSGI